MAMSTIYVNNPGMASSEVMEGTFSAENETVPAVKYECMYTKT